MSIGATNKSNLYAPPASQASTLIPTYTFFSSKQSNNAPEEQSLESKPSNNFQKGLLKLSLDTLMSGIVMFITYWKGGGLAAMTGKRSNKINEGIRQILLENGRTKELKDFNTHLNNMAVMGSVSHGAFHKYWEFFTQYKSDLLKRELATSKELNKHEFHNKTFRKLESGAIISILSWARAVFFAPNVSWNNLNLFSPQAMLALGFPLVANAGYWYVYDRHAPSIPAMLLGLNLTNYLDPILDWAKACLKGMKRFVPTDNLTKDLTFLAALIGSAYAVRFARNELEDPILNRVFNAKKFGPQNLKQAIGASAIRAGMKALIDTSVFAGLIGALTIVMDQLFKDDKPLTGYSHFQFTQSSGQGLTAQSLNFASIAA